MKNNFRKVVSVILAVMMLVSLCTVAITSVSAETTTPTLADFNVVNGSWQDSEKIVADPVVDGGYALRMKTTAGGRMNYLLSFGEDADGDGNIDPAAPVAGTYYTVKFDYYVESAAGAPDFNLYYGKDDPSASKAGGDIGTASSKGSARKYCVDREYIMSVAGDGAWHSAAISFKASDRTHSTSGDALPYLYLTYYAGVNDGTNNLTGYIKNIEIVTESADVNHYNEEVYLNHYFNEDGTANADMFQAIANDGSASPMTNSYINEDGDYVFVPTSDVLDTAYTSGQNIKASADYIELLKADGSTYTCTSDTNFSSNGKNNRYCLIKYKVVKIGDSGFACIGFGRASSTAGSTIAYSSIKVTETSSEWRYAVLFMYSNGSGPDLRLSFGGIGSKIVIDSVYYCYTGRSANVILTTFNDNGGALHIRAGYKGTDFAPVMGDGANAENLAMGEKFMGWYADTHYATPVTVFPDNSATLYARYPSAVIDFNYRTSYTSKHGTAHSATADNVNGTFTTVFNSSGFMLPSYDADIDDTDGSATALSEAFYQFKNGVEYKLTLVINSNNVACNSVILLTCAIDAGTSGWRATGSDNSHKKQSIPVIETPTTVEMEFTFELAKDGYTGIAFRTNNTSYKPTVVFDKIIITEISDETSKGYATRIIADDGATEQILAADAAVGDLIVMPEAPEKEDMMFVGWYDTSVNLEQVNSNGLNVSEDYIPVSAIRVTEDMQGTTTTYAAKYISTEAETIDFEEEYYQGNDRGGYAWSETPIKATTTDETTTYSAASNGDRAWPFTIQDDGNGDHYAYIDTLTVNETLGKAAGSNHWKIQLFHDDGSYIHVYEGVTYKITMKYEVVTASDETYDASKEIGISRAVAGGYMPRALDGTRQGQNRYGYANEDAVEAGVQEITKELRVENTYHAFSGDRSTGACVLSNALAVKVFSGVVKVYEVIVEPVSYTAPALHDIDLTKGSADIDYENGTITLTPNEGYEVSAAGVSAVQYYNDYSVDGTTVTIVENEVDYFNLMPTANGGSTDDGLTFKFDNNIEGAKLSSYRFMVDFVETNDSTVNAATIGFSVRTASGEGDTYESAGIRFRFRASAQTVANADKVEFVIVPTAALGESTIEAYMAADGSAAVTGVAKNDTKHVVYENVGTYYDYQAILTGLTNEDGRDLTDLQLSVAFRVTVGETVTYIELGKSVCYNDYFAN